MKIKPEHLAILKSMVSMYDTDFHRSRYQAAGLSDKRYRWDLLYHASRVRRNTHEEDFVCDVLYKYMNDDHIDTALRRLIKPF